MHASLIGSHQDPKIGNRLGVLYVVYVAPISYRTQTIRVPIMIPAPVWYTRYWYITITLGGIADHADRTDPTQVNMCEISRSYRSRVGKHQVPVYVKDLDHTDPIQANMCE